MHHALLFYCPLSMCSIASISVYILDYFGIIAPNFSQWPNALAGESHSPKIRQLRNTWILLGTMQY